jgi:hypothetical protein
MTKTAVHVTTLDQWKSVLDIWFKQGYEWIKGGQEYYETAFEEGGRYLYLGDYIIYGKSDYNSKPFIEYSEFMGQKKEDKKMKTIYVTQYQLDLIEELKERLFPLGVLYVESDRYEDIHINLDHQEQKVLLRYLGGDETIEFKVKEQLYRLWRIDDAGDRVYMVFTFGTPGWSSDKDTAFTAPLEEIKKWQTPAWSLEKVD